MWAKKLTDVRASVLNISSPHFICMHGHLPSSCPCPCWCVMLCVSRGCLPSLPAQSCRSHTTGPCKGRPIAERFDEASPSLEADPTIMRALCAALPADLALVTFDPSHLKTLRQCAVLITESREAKLPRALESWGRRHAARVCQAHYRARLAAERLRCLRGSTSMRSRAPTGLSELDPSTAG